MCPFLSPKNRASTRRITHLGFSLIVLCAVSFLLVLLLMMLLFVARIVRHLGQESLLILCSESRFFILSHLCSACLCSTQLLCRFEMSSSHLTVSKYKYLFKIFLYVRLFGSGFVVTLLNGVFAFLPKCASNGDILIAF